MAASVEIVSLATARYRMQAMSKIGKMTGFDGRHEWIRDEAFDDICDRFRNAILNKNYIVAIDMLCEIMTIPQAESIAKLLMQRENAETSKEALLLAISIGSRPLVEMILSLFREFAGEESRGCISSEYFQPHMTPLMLACIGNNFAITSCLLLRNHAIDLPHFPDCVCVDCKCYSTRMLENAMQRIDKLRAISSEAYLWLATPDPLLASFQLSSDFVAFADTDQTHKDLYIELDKNVCIFACTVAQQCCNYDEVVSLLTRTEGVSASSGLLRFPRLRLALDCEMKEFLSSANVQKVLESDWLGDWTDWGQNVYQDVLSRLPRVVFFYPITSLLFIVSFGSIFNVYKYPFARYLSYMTSYAVFLFALTTIIQRRGNAALATDRSMNNDTIQFTLEIYIWLYALGLILRDFSAFAQRGISSYFAVWWRGLDFVLLNVCVVAFVVWCGSLQTSHSDSLYTLHRRQWPMYDPHLFYDVFFAIVCILSFWRVFYFLQTFQKIGGTIISIGHCIREIINHFSIMVTAMISFGVGVNCIYGPYTGTTVNHPNGTIQQMPIALVSITRTISRQYWAFYGYLPPSDMHIVAGQAGPDRAPTHHLWTQFFGEWLIGIYHAVVLLTILKLMVALMVRTADKVLENEDMEWKYIRCHMWAEFYEPWSSVPPPFNLLHLVFWAIAEIRNPDNKIVWWPDLWISKTNTMDFGKYQELLVCLFERYRARRECHHKTMMQIDAMKSKAPSASNVMFIGRSSHT